MLKWRSSATLSSLIFTFTAVKNITWDQRLVFHFISSRSLLPTPGLPACLFYLARHKKEDVLARKESDGCWRADKCVICRWDMGLSPLSPGFLRGRIYIHENHKKSHKNDDCLGWWNGERERKKIIFPGCILEIKVPIHDYRYTPYFFKIKKPRVSRP
jgi:hypothetical protein